MTSVDSAANITAVNRPYHDEGIPLTGALFRDDPAVMARRARAGLAALSQCPCAGGPVAAVGFCFGGLVALTLARAGEPLAGAVSIQAA